MKKRIEVKVTGIVQGVCFRAYTRDFAKRIGVNGYVRNLVDGSVEIVAEGEEEKLWELIKFAKRGPPSARVYNIDVKWTENLNQFNNFTIKY
ncbi:MAG: acylphosphatase [Candidatus Heimdallarchaeaceae archaeon]|uniref:Acylphosphatase n=1 Tax=Candidatus Heimdallarchaeum endolithica TaxID=2876572 RepID=A0A9Y1BQK8_9ARCH|nr:MAG: acylphosphatase [Candidatus Heimdallarchaeum endolithica]